jgi:hypothetical protein
MPRPRTPTAKLAAKGSFLKHPERKRKRAREPKPTGSLGAPPRRLSVAQKEIWLELAALIPPGVAANCDRWAVELLACLMAKFRSGRAKISEAKQIESLLGKMGMTPADRSRVSADLADSMRRNTEELSALPTQEEWDKL